MGKTPLRRMSSVVVDYQYFLEIKYRRTSMISTVFDILYVIHHIRGVFDKFEDNIDNILIPNRKVWWTLSLETLTYCVRIV